MSYTHREPEKHFLGASSSFKMVMVTGARQVGVLNAPELFEAIKVICDETDENPVSDFRKSDINQAAYLYFFPDMLPLRNVDFPAALTVQKCPPFYRFINTTERSLTFVPVGPVIIRLSTAFNALYASLSFSTFATSMFFSFNCVAVSPVTIPPAASVGPSVPSDPKLNTQVFLHPSI